MRACCCSWPSFWSSVRGGQIRSPDNLVILTPGQGATWDVGTDKVITWDPLAIEGDVKISLSRQGGKDGTFETIVESTENNGSYTWTVIGDESGNCMLKIEPVNDPAKGSTLGLFTINPKAFIRFTHELHNRWLCRV